MDTPSPQESRGIGGDLSTVEQANQLAIGFEALSRETGVSVELLRTFAAISDPANEHLFTAESARRAIAKVTAETSREQ